MRDVRELMVHAVLFVAAAVFAFVVWTGGDEEQARADSGLMVEVWPGRKGELKRIEWEGKAKVRVEAQRDAKGAFYVATVVKRQVTLTPDSGEQQESRDSKQEPEEKTIRFISVGAAEPLVKALTPLKAVRALGNLDEARRSEFGFEEPDGTLRVVYGDQERSLLVGGTTPGGGDRYAKDADGDTLYVVSGDVIRNIANAEQRLFERDLHEFELDDIDTLTIEFERKTRTLVRPPDSDDGWASSDTPQEIDETAGNWVEKLNRLRPSEYTDQPPAGLGPESVVLRVQYLEGRRPRGILELSSVPGEKGRDYYVRTEQTRNWYAKVLQSAGEQLEQDVTSVVR